MSAAVSRRLDDEGLPLPPPVHGRVSGVLLRVVLAPAHEAFQVTVTPFLVIGIISATRDILTVGAELSLTGGSGPPLGRSMTELAVNAGGVLALAVALVLVRRFARLDRA